VAPPPPGPEPHPESLHDRLPAAGRPRTPGLVLCRLERSLLYRAAFVPPLPPKAGEGWGGGRSAERSGRRLAALASATTLASLGPPPQPSPAFGGRGGTKGTLADCIAFPPLGYAQRMAAVTTLSRALGHGRKSGFNPRVSYNVALPPRLSVAFNPYHLAAGAPNSTGGQFTNREGATTVALSRRERDENFQRMKDAIARRPDLPAAVREAAIEIFDVEGRGAIDSNSGAVAGITQTGLTQAKNLGTPGLQSVRSPSDLNKDQIVSVYNALISDALKESGGSRRLDSFSDRRTAVAVADTSSRTDARAGVGCSPPPRGTF
jgi:hypothetical protein